MSNLDKSLDDIAAERRSQGGAGGGRRGGRGSGGGGGGKIRGQQNGQRGARSAPYSRPPRAPRADGDSWSHDQFDDVDAPAPVRGGRTGGLASAAGVSSEVTLKISNLHFDVSEGDLKSLYSEFGKITKVAIRYDRAGRSTGEAEVHFTDPAAANAAVRKYQGVSLDNQPMRLEILAPVSNVRSRLGAVGDNFGGGRRGGSQQQQRGTGRPSHGDSAAAGRGGRGAGGRGGRGGNGGAPRAPRAEKVVDPTALDAALDSYMSTVNE